jgi:phosphatidylinositol alpha-mannosyltransferase
MRILQVCPYAWNARGGVQTHVANLSRQLRLRGHDVLVVAPGHVPHTAGAEDGVHIAGASTAVPFNGSVARICLRPGGWLEARRALARFAPDLVHVHEPFVPSVSMPVAWSARVPVVATFHAYCPPSVEALLYSGLAAALRLLVSRFALKLAVSEAAARCAEKRVGGPIRIVPNGVDLERFSPSARTPSVGARKLLFVNRLERRKGFDVALRAFARLADAHDDLLLIVVGSGACSGAREDLPEHIRRRVIMLGDVSDAELPSVYSSADVFLAPARGRESFGIVLIEAMAAGVPVVATDIDGYRELLQHEHNALVVPPDDVHALTIAIARLLANRHLGRELVTAARARVVSYGWEEIAAHLERCYATALGTVPIAPAACRQPQPAPSNLMP